MMNLYVLNVVDNNMVGIYKIENKFNGKLYIGQSIDCKDRLRKHKWLLKNNKHHNEYLQNSYNKYGRKCFKFSIIEECSKDNLNIREMFWIKKFNTYDFKFGYNNTLGGGEYEWADEVKKKISNSLLGHVVSKETRIKISNSLKGKNAGEDNYMYGQEHSEETKEKISKKLTGRKLTDECKKKISKSYRYDLHEKPVLQYSKEGIFIKRWSSIKKAAKGTFAESTSKSLKAFEGNIPVVCRQRRGSIGGFIWRYDEHDKIPLSIDTVDKRKYNDAPFRGKAIIQYSLDGVPIKKWRSIRQAAEALGKCRKYISQCCNGKREVVGSYIFRFVKEK